MCLRPCRSAGAPSISAHRSEVVDGREALIGQRGERVAEPAVLPTQCGRRRARSARAAFRSRATSRGRSSTMATAGRRWRRAVPISSERAHSSTLVASTTVSRPRRSRMASDAVQQVEGVVGGALGAGIVGDHRAHGVRGEDLGRGEVALCEGALAAGRHPDQEDQRVGGDRSATETDRPPRSSAAGEVVMEADRISPGGRSPGTSPSRGSGPSADPWRAAGRVRRWSEPGSPTRWTLLKWRSGSRHVT